MSVAWAFVRSNRVASLLLAGTASAVFAGTASAVFFTSSAAAAAKPNKVPAKPAVEKQPAPARSFEQIFEDAEPVGSLGRLIEPLFDSCDPSDPLELRQCQGTRSFLEAETRGRTYVAIGDPAALSVNPYDATMKQLDIDVSGCLACLHPLAQKDAKGASVSRFVTTKAPRAIKSGHAVGIDIATMQIPMNAEREARWKKLEKRVTPRLRAQFVFKLGPVWSSGTFSGVSFVPLAYRVFDACTGEVFGSSPAVEGDAQNTKVTTKVAVPVTLQAGDNLTCPAPGEDLTPEERAAKEEFAKLPRNLSRDQIERGMSDVQERVHDCHVEFEETGTVSLRVVVEGPTGKVKEVQIYPPFDKTPAGLCVRAAIKSASFGRFKADTQEIKVPVYLR